MSQLTSASPQAPSDVIARADAADRAAVRAAADRARTVGREWSRQPGPVRAGALQAVAARLGQRAREVEDLVVREVGKPRIEARGEVARAQAIFAYYAQQVLDPIGETYPPSAAGLLYTERRSRGVALLIAPWNFPVGIPAWKAAPALAAGNAVLLKPSTQALGCAQLLGELLADALPAGLFTVLPARRRPPTRSSPPLTSCRSPARPLSVVRSRWPRRDAGSLSRPRWAARIPRSSCRR